MNYKQLDEHFLLWTFFWLGVGLTLGLFLWDIVASETGKNINLTDIILSVDVTDGIPCTVTLTEPDGDSAVYKLQYEDC